MAANADVNAEWIVVDDGSGAAFADVFCKLNEFPVRLIRLPINRRQAAARNIGLAKARGVWIKFLDVDDQLDQGHLATLISASKNGPSDAIPFAPTRHVLPSGKSWLNDSWRDMEPSPEVQLSRMLHAPFLSHCGALFPRALLLKLGGYDETLITDEDGDLLIRVLMSGARFYPVPEVSYHYIHHGDAGRVSLDIGTAKLSARLRVCTKVEDAFVNRPMPPAVQQGLARRLDKIAMAYWNQDRFASMAVLQRARCLCPDYKPPGRWPTRLLRQFGGPSAQLTAAYLLRHLRCWLVGGALG
jgi:glycosyltransferase involved in cell wall biosynthesis